MVEVINLENKDGKIKITKKTCKRKKKDEVNALVLDIGTTMTRAGYAGEDTPRVMFPTSFGYIDKEEPIQTEDVVMAEQGEEAQPPAHQTKRQYYIGDNKINKFRSNMEVQNPMEDGMGKLYQKKSEVKGIKEFLFSQRLGSY